MLNLIFFATLSFSIAEITLANYLFYQDRKDNLNYLSAARSLSLGAYGLISALSIQAGIPETGLILERVKASFYLLLFALAVHFAWSWTRPKDRQRLDWLVVLVYSSWTVFAILSISSALRWPRMPGQPEEAIPLSRMTAAVMALAHLWTVALAGLVIVRTVLHFQSNWRTPQRWVDLPIFLGLGVPFTLGMLLDLLPRIFYIELPSLALVWFFASDMLVGFSLIRRSSGLPSAQAVLEGVYASVEEALVLLDSRGLIRSINPKFFRLTGFPAEELVGQPVSALFPDAAFSLQMDFHRVLHDEPIQEEVIQLPVASQQTLPVCMTARAVTHRRGQPAGVLISLKDLSERKETERELARLQKQVQQMAIRDPLTGLYNRRHLIELAERELELVRRYGSPLTIALMDVDDFKSHNKRYGQQGGDLILQMVAQLCLKSLRRVDIIGRYSGEEFLILLPVTNLSNGMITAERLRKTLAEMPVEINGESVRVTVSLALVGVDSSTSTLEVFLARIDQALRVARKGGRNLVVAWEPAMGETRARE